MTDFSRNKSSRAASLVYSDEINDKLLKLMNDTGYSIEQVNGQRIFASPRQDIIPPSRGCEVFVGKIPRDCYEDELFPILARAGRVHELRLMMLFSGTNRGYAFVMYERPEDARRAVELLDGYEVRRGHRIGVLPCQNNCRLFIGCFGPGDRTPADLEQVLRTETEGVAAVWRRSATAARQRWYLLVEYVSHRAAAVARRHLTPRRDIVFGPRVIVDWEVPLERRGRNGRGSGPSARRSQAPLQTAASSAPLSQSHSLLQSPSTLPSSKLRQRAHSDASVDRPTFNFEDLGLGGRKSMAAMAGYPSAARSPSDTTSPNRLSLNWQQSVDVNGGLNNALAASLNWLPSFRNQGNAPGSGPIDVVSMLRRCESPDHERAHLRRQWPPQASQQTFRDTPPYPSLQQLLLSPDSGLFSDPELNQHPASSPGSSGSASSTTESPWGNGDRLYKGRCPAPRSPAPRARLAWDSNPSDYLSCSISELEGLCLNDTVLSTDSLPEVAGRSPADRLPGRRFLFGNGDMHWLDNSVDSHALRCGSQSRISPFC